MTGRTFVGFGGCFPVLRLDDGQTDLPLFVHVRMVDRRQECDLRRLERIIFRKVDSNAKRAQIVRRSGLQLRTYMRSMLYADDIDLLAGSCVVTKDVGYMYSVWI